MEERKKEIVKQLRQLRYLEDDDNIRYKNIIKEELLNNDKLLFLLNPDKLDDPDSYFGEEIRPRYYIDESISSVKNFLCFTVNSTKLASRYSNTNKINSINFYILCDHETVNVPELGINRHDAIGAMIKNAFNWTNKFGLQVTCTHDEEVMVDQEYVARRLYFEIEAPAGIVKTYFDEGSETPISRVVRSDVVT